MEVKHAANAEELQRMIEEDELADQMEVVGKASPLEYAKAHGLQPQLVYYYIRQGKIQVERCICGRKVIDVKAAEEFFSSKDKPKESSVRDVDEPQVD